MSVFYRVSDVPVNSVFLVRDRKTALAYPKGDIALGFCKSCGYISNVAFDPDLPKYSSDYEESQGFSDTFSAFHRRLANKLIKTYDLHDKSIMEIGCGKGEFLSLLCKLGENHGVGFDPAYVDGRIGADKSNRVTFIRDFYSEKYADYDADFVCCKMTLEHIHRANDFVSTIRRSIGDQVDTRVFFQVPDVSRILKELAFWDIYYEHCSYFSSGSLARLCRTCGFHITDLWKEYDDQYLMLVARPFDSSSADLLPQEDDFEELANCVAHFSHNVDHQIDGWQCKLKDVKEKGKKAVIWGGGSKGVAFLSTLDIREEIEYVVDVNPHKHGTYMAGTGQEIVEPDFLRSYKPDVVIVMNPIYGKEIQDALRCMECTPQVVRVDRDDTKTFGN
jgi:SAM-dependent methyltransferase